MTIFGSTGATAASCLLRAARRICVGALIGVVAAPSLALANPPAVAAPPPTVAPPAGKSAREPPRRRLTKFEARRIRHACHGRANERGLSGPEREGFLSKCYFGRVANRVERQLCRQEAAARGVDKSALRGFLRECVRERVRAKEER